MKRQRTTPTTEEEGSMTETMDWDKNQEHRRTSAHNGKQAPSNSLVIDLITPRHCAKNTQIDFDTSPQLELPPTMLSYSANKQITKSEQSDPVGQELTADTNVEPSQKESHSRSARRKKKKNNVDNEEAREYIMIEDTPERHNSGDLHAPRHGKSDKSHEVHIDSPSVRFNRPASSSENPSQKKASNPSASRARTKGPRGRHRGTVDKRNKDESIFFEDEPEVEPKVESAEDTPPRLPNAQRKPLTDEEMARKLQEEEYASFQPRSAFYGEFSTPGLPSPAQDIPEPTSERPQTQTRSRTSAQSGNRSRGRARGSTARGRTRSAQTSNSWNNTRGVGHRLDEPQFDELAYLAQEYEMQDQEWQSMLGYGPLGRHPGNWVDEDDIDMSYEGLLRLGEQVGNVKQNCVNDAIIRNLPTKQYTARKVSEGDATVSDDGSCKCTICLTEYEHGETVKSLPCFHSFHIACIDHWMFMNECCPICRIKIETS